MHSCTAYGVGSPVDGNRDTAASNILLRLRVALGRADITHVPTRWYSSEPLTILQQPGKQVETEIEGDASGNVVKDRRFHNVHTRIREIAARLTRPGFFDEALDTSAVVDFDNPGTRGILH